MSQILEQIRKGAIPEHAKKAVVQGVLPMESEDLLRAIYLICSQDEGLIDVAKETFVGLPEGVKKTFFEDRAIESGALRFYLVHFPIPDEAKTAALLNANIEGATLVEVAPALEANLLDLAVNNQVKIQEEPEIVAALRRNPALSVTQKQRLDEYERLLLKELVSEPEQLENLSIREVEESAIAEAHEFVRVFGKERETEKTKPVATTARAASADKETSGKDKARMSVLEKLTGMTVPQKVQAAIKGDREIRSILVRDANKLVCTAVIKSPRITDAEVEFYSNLRNVQQEVLRLIANNREWMKSYKIVHNLVKNPRTPIAQSIRLLPRLNKKDIQHLMRDKGVPEALRTMARKFTVQR